MTTDPKTPENPDPENPQKALVAAALALAGEGKWADSSLADCAQRAGLKLSVLFETARSKAQILELVEQDLIRRVVTSAGAPDTAMSVREVLFDLLMTRFECMNENRDAFLVLSRSARPRPGSLSRAVCANRSMGFLANLAGVETEGPLGCMRLAGLHQVYAQVLAVWRKDETGDLGPTMKALDTRLAQAEARAKRLNGFESERFDLKPIADSFRKFGEFFAKGCHFSGSDSGESKTSESKAG